MNAAFLPWLVNHLWQSTLCAGAAGLIVLALRKNSAAARYRLWLAASLKFLIPFSLLVNLGHSLGWPAKPEAPAVSMAPIALEVPATESESKPPAASIPVFDRIAAPLALAAPVASPVEALPLESEWPRRLLIIGAVIWILGFGFQLISWMRQWRILRTRKRNAVPLEIDVPALIPAMSSPMSIEPSIFGIFNPVLLLPENILDDLTPAQVESILLHESAHVQRRDNLAAAVHMVVETLFWFHPMVWWIGKRMVEERERACDEDVLQRFEEPGTYAEAILTVCKLHLKTPLACTAGVASSNLRERIETIMNYRKPWNLNVGKKLLVASFALLALFGPIFAGMVKAGRLPAPPADGAYAFSSIDIPGATSTVARGINGVGRVVGSFTDNNGTHGFLYSNGAFSTIDFPGSTWTIATGINNVGQIVGGYGTGADAGNHGFFYSGGSFSSFDYPGSLDTIGYGINNNGQIVGSFLGTDTYRHGFRLSGGNYSVIEVPESRAGTAEGINDAGQIVGLSGYGGSAVGFFFNGSGYAKIQVTSGTYSDARGLNNVGDIAVQDGGPQSPFRGFLRNGTTVSPVDLPGSPYSWNVQGINDLGQIVGVFEDRDGRTHGYLATPATFKAQPANGDGTSPRLVTAVNDPTANGGLPGLQGPQGPQGPPGPPGPPGPAVGRGGPDAGQRGRGGARGGGDLRGLQDAFRRTAGSVRRGSAESPFNQRTLAALARADSEITAAMAFLEQHPDAAAAPPVPPKTTPEFALPPSQRGLYPGREVTLNNLKEDFDRLNKTPGGDLGGSREKIHSAIAAAANETIGEIIFTTQERSLTTARNAIQRAANNIQRTGPETNPYAQRAMSAVNQAVIDIAAAITYSQEHPSAAASTGAIIRPDFAPPLGDRGRYPTRETALNNLASAFDTLVQTPGGDFGGLRSKILNEITSASNEMIADIAATALRERLEKEAVPAPGKDQ